MPDPKPPPKSLAAWPPAIEVYSTATPTSKSKRKYATRRYADITDDSDEDGDDRENVEDDIGANLDECWNCGRGFKVQFHFSFECRLKLTASIV